ncbi:uncharacterized protein LOC135110459 [Scylla paramamosain]|uniref:uncharacterized protein LOC135110459 n=1 Tax=Scylla paramamosain TaxID=85552 RepID=UPI0030835CB6
MATRRIVWEKREKHISAVDLVIILQDTDRRLGDLRLMKRIRQWKCVIDQSDFTLRFPVTENMMLKTGIDDSPPPENLAEEEEEEEDDNGTEGFLVDSSKVLCTDVYEVTFTSRPCWE